MTITAEQAKAELARRAGGGGAPAPARTSGITAGQAQAELERRRSAGAANEPGLMQQLFDVKNSTTGELYLYGNTPPPAPYEDLERTVADTVSRGYLDKLRGPEAQAQTSAARERMPAWVEIPTDVGAAVASAPYRIGSMGVGALAGAAEGAASAYGHQEDWIPDAEGWGDIAKGTGIGIVAGAGGAKVGEWLGGKAATSEVAASPEDLASRASNVDKIRAAKGTPRDDFSQLMADLENASPEVQAKVVEIAGGKSLVRRAGEVADRTGKRMSLPLLMIESVASGGIPYKTLGGMAAKHVVSKAGKAAANVSDKEAAALADLARNGELDIDPAVIDRWRDALAKSSIGYGRSP